MKLLLLAGFAVLSLLFAGADRLNGPDAARPWAASVPVHSPR